MARSNVNINHINDDTSDNKPSGKKRTTLPWHILALFAMLCCNAALPVAAATVADTSVDSSTEAIVDAVSSDAAVDDDGVSVAKRSAEDPQLQHFFRHQEHYSHRIEQAVNDLKRTQLQQQLSGNYSNTTANNVDGSVNGDNSGTSDNDDNNNNNYMHYQSQLQPRKSEHLRHHNQRHHSVAPVNAWERYLLPPLRHQRHQQERQQNQQPEYAADATMVVTTAPLMPLVAPTATELANDAAAVATTNEQANILPAITRSANGSSVQQQLHIKPHRYFDRDGLYQSSSYIWTTRGPRVRSNANYWRTKDFPSTHLSGGAKQTDSQRISLNLNADSEDESYTHEESREKKFKSNEPRGNVDADNDSEIVNDDNDSSSDDYDDYSYEEDSTEAAQSANEFPNVNNMYDREHRSAVKRYTNPFNDLRLPPKKRDYSPHPYMSLRRRTVPGGNAHNAYANFGVDSVDDNSEVDFSSEKWQRIRQEHHRKQQEHQRRMMALRARHAAKSSATAAAATATPLIMAAAAAPSTQQRQNDDEDANNINSQYYIPGTLTRQKQEELGTPDAVQETRRSHVKHKHEKALASEHVKQIRSEAACRVPQRRVERIQRDPSKTYTPHCTVLHRCTDETGCCRSERQTCAPKRTKNVDLYFYVHSINEKGTVERLTFVNHTECHCVEKTQQQVDEYHNMAMYDMTYGGQTMRHATIVNCNCPKLYEKILQEDGFCRCDCSSGNTGCDWLKRGMEHFSMIDRKCISEGRCKPPTCEHGNYIKKFGRCPRREEQLPAALTEPVMMATNALSSSDYH
ncbi:uncharacterized protein DDB_G0283357-like [Bactrocera neohumeralis]|uniref:uncharacterized protein DDB_G0283357-like n=1 Tax=Bactrocera neohumeralis TaxID=98809 RepID=UPI002165F751|nr:uncharacterized protein DDB_G0283357-like [Bactrocera neohumeralis]